MLVQFLTIKSEKNQQTMISFLFLIFIIYSLYSATYLGLYSTIILIVLLSYGVFFYMKKQLSSKTVVQLQVSIKSSKQKSLKRSLKWVILPFLIYTILTIIHFGIVYSSGESIVPLFYDYGLGGVFAVGLNFYISNNWNIGLCDEGLIVGSKFDSKLIKWEEIKIVNYYSSSIDIFFIKGFPFEKVSISNSIDTFEKLLKYKV